VKSKKVGVGHPFKYKHIAKYFDFFVILLKHFSSLSIYLCCVTVCPYSIWNCKDAKVVTCLFLWSIMSHQIITIHYVWKQKCKYHTGGVYLFYILLSSLWSLVCSTIIN